MTTVYFYSALTARGTAHASKRSPALPNFFKPTASFMSFCIPHYMEHNAVKSLRPKADTMCS